MLNLILNSLVPVFFGIGLGLVGGWTRDVDNHHVGELNALVMDFAVPASIFAAVVSTSGGTLNDQLGLAGVLTVTMLLMYAEVFVMARRAYGSTPGEAAIQAITTGLPNYASAGLPLIAALLGKGHTVSVAVAIACGSIFMSPVTLTILSLQAKRASFDAIVSAFLGACKKPIVLAPIIAVVFVFTDIHIPESLEHSFLLAGEVSGGAGLFLTGLTLSGQKLRFDTNVAIQVALANIVQPLLAAATATATAWAVGSGPQLTREAVLLAALPSGFFGILFGLRANVTHSSVGTSVVVSTALSAATLPVAIYLTAGMSAA
jgi:malonate transporter and related proteins